jgi:hypothetical protein
MSHEKRRMSTNPYTVMPVCGENFIGRKDLLEKLLDEPSCHLLIGTPRIGKTSILRQVQYLAHQRRQPAFYISFEGITSRDKLQRRLHIRLRGERAPWFDFSKVGFDIDLFKKADVFEALEELDNRLNGHVLFLLFDEAQLLVELGQNSPEMLQEWRAALQFFQNIRTIFAAFPYILKLNNWISSPFLNVFASHYISVLDESDAEELVKRPGIQISPSHMDELFEYAGYHPYFLQLLCSSLYQKGKLARPSLKSLVAAYHSIPMEAILLNAFAALEEEEKAVMLAIHEKGSANLRTLRATFPASRTIEKTVDRLVRYCYVKKCQADFKIINAFWSKWLEEEAVTVA